MARRLLIAAPLLATLLLSWGVADVFAQQRPARPARPAASASADAPQAPQEISCEQRLGNVEQAATFARRLLLSDYAATQGQVEALVRALTQAREENEKLKAEMAAKKPEPKEK